MNLTIESALRGEHDKELNQRICEWLGIKPRRRWRVFYDAERLHGSCDMSTREDALRRIAIEKENAEQFGILSDYEFSEPEEYDDWSEAPNHIKGESALGHCHKAEKRLSGVQSAYYDCKLTEITSEGRFSMDKHSVPAMHYYDALTSNRATSRQRTVAMLLTVTPEVFIC